MKKIIILILSVLSIIYVFINNQRVENIIPQDAIRFRVIANSNTIYDQNIKLQVKNVVQNKILELLADSSSIEDTRTILKNNIQEIDEIVRETLKKLDYDKDYKIKYGLNYFPKKEYKGIEYKEGKYESLVISLGNANGDNWWCVLFPPLCLVESEENTKADPEYSFFLKEFIEKYTNKK